MLAYSLLLLGVLVVGAPYWLTCMATSGRYRAGLAGRLGRVPSELRAAAAGRDVIWLHAVSVGEVMAATRLVREMESALPGWVIVVSTTTATGQALAQERFGRERVFFYPLDLGWAVKAYLKALRPKMLVLMESELWPRMLVECGRAGVPVAVANARVSDRSFARGVRVRPVWERMLRRVDLFAAQSDEDARRLIAMGARRESVMVAGNLKYDVRTPGQNRVADLIREMVGDRPVVVAGSTTEEKDEWEEILLLQAWTDVRSVVPGAVLVVAPRHPERFDLVYSIMKEYGTVRATELISGTAGTVSFEQSRHGSTGGENSRSCSRMTTRKARAKTGHSNLNFAVGGNILLDTIGDLAAVYGVADVAFVGGSLVAKGGHNPLEPAQFGVPVVMGASYENFRDVAARMLEAGGMRVVKDKEELTAALIELLQNRELADAMGERGRAVFVSQAGATARTVGMLRKLLPERAMAL